MVILPCPLTSAARAMAAFLRPVPRNAPVRLSILTGTVWGVITG
jgi:hypothetical protein